MKYLLVYAALTMTILLIDEVGGSRVFPCATHHWLFGSPLIISLVLGGGMTVGLWGYVRRHRLTHLQLPLVLIGSGLTVNLTQIMVRGAVCDYWPVGPWQTKIADLLITVGVLWCMGAGFGFIRRGQN
jgi:lipoprotein signal peptidase